MSELVASMGAGLTQLFKRAVSPTPTKAKGDGGKAQLSTAGSRAIDASKGKLQPAAAHKALVDRTAKIIARDTRLQQAMKLEKSPEFQAKYGAANNSERFRAGFVVAAYAATHPDPDDGETESVGKRVSVEQAESDLGALIAKLRKADGALEDGDTAKAMLADTIRICLELGNKLAALRNSSPAPAPPPAQPVATVSEPGQGSNGDAHIKSIEAFTWSAALNYKGSEPDKKELARLAKEQSEDHTTSTDDKKREWEKSKEKMIAVLRAGPPAASSSSPGASPPPDDIPPPPEFAVQNSLSSTNLDLSAQPTSSAPPTEPLPAIFQKENFDAEVSVFETSNLQPSKVNQNTVSSVANPSVRTNSSGAGAAKTTTDWRSLDDVGPPSDDKLAAIENLSFYDARNYDSDDDSAKTHLATKASASPDAAPPPPPTGSKPNAGPSTAETAPAANPGVASQPQSLLEQIRAGANLRKVGNNARGDGSSSTNTGAADNANDIASILSKAMAGRRDPIVGGNDVDDDDWNDDPT